MEYDKNSKHSIHISSLITYIRLRPYNCSHYKYDDGNVQPNWLFLLNVRIFVVSRSTITKLTVMIHDWLYFVLHLDQLPTKRKCSQESGSRPSTHHDVSPTQLEPQISWKITKKQKKREKKCRQSIAKLVTCYHLKTNFQIPFFLSSLNCFYLRAFKTQLHSY